MNDKPMLKCGHRANATCDGKPICVICAPSPESMEIVEEPDLINRKCMCTYCDRVVLSKDALAFFEHRPDKEFDQDYCGCRGWG